MKAQIDIVGSRANRFVVFDGWKNGRRQNIFATYIREKAEAELKRRNNG